MLRSLNSKIYSFLDILLTPFTTKTYRKCSATNKEFWKRPRFCTTRLFCCRLSWLE